MNRRLLSFFAVTLLLALSTVIVILVAKGYRFDDQTRSLQGTGIISVSSIPAGASIYLDGEFVSATNNTISNLTPKTYQLKVIKDGFSTWEKSVIVAAEKVSLVTITLFPTAPDLRPLTFSGVKSPKISPDGQRLVYAVTAPAKAGLWMLDLSNQFFTFSRDPKQIASDTAAFSFSGSDFSWAPDSRTILVSGKTPAGKSVNYLLDSDTSNDSPVDVSQTITKTTASWQSDLDLKNKDLLSHLSQKISADVTASPKALWSPDDLKVAFEKGGETKVYDLKTETLSSIPQGDFSWFPDSAHLILVNDSNISIVESDGGNKTTIYGGSFDKSAVFPWPDGSKLIILTTFNQSAGENLYSVGLR